MDLRVWKTEIVNSTVKNDFAPSRSRFSVEIMKNRIGSKKRRPVSLTHFWHTQISRQNYSSVNFSDVVHPSSCSKSIVAPPPHEDKIIHSQWFYDIRSLMSSDGVRRFSQFVRFVTRCITLGGLVENYCVWLLCQSPSKRLCLLNVCIPAKKTVGGCLYEQSYLLLGIAASGGTTFLLTPTAAFYCHRQRRLLGKTSDERKT